MPGDTGTRGWYNGRKEWARRERQNAREGKRGKGTILSETRTDIQEHVSLGFLSPSPVHVASLCLGGLCSFLGHDGFKSWSVGEWCLAPVVQR